MYIISWWPPWLIQRMIVVPNHLCIKGPGSDILIFILNLVNSSIIENPNPIDFPLCSLSWLYAYTWTSTYHPLHCISAVRWSDRYWYQLGPVTWTAWQTHIRSMVMAHSLLWAIRGPNPLGNNDVDCWFISVQNYDCARPTELVVAQLYWPPCVCRWNGSREGRCSLTNANGVV